MLLISCNDGQDNLLLTYLVGSEPTNSIQEDVVNIGAIGDVKYSVLAPDKFKEHNGEGWVLMDNNMPISGSKLGDEGILELPDARGMFIRGLNLDRDDELADPYLKEKSQARVLGDYQADSFKSHQHSLNYAIGFSNLGNGHPFRISGDDGGPWGGVVYTLTAEATGEIETRPKNIALYIYVKIN